MGLFDFDFDNVFNFDYDYRKRSAMSNPQLSSRSYPMQYPELAIKQAGPKIGEYEAEFQDMDIFGRFGPDDLDLFCRPRNGRLRFSNTLFL